MLISPRAIVEFDRWIDDEIEAVLQFIEAGATPTASSDLPIYNVLRYHLGTANAAFEPETADRGKRLRSKLCLLCCEAAGGDPRHAVPIAASIELLHNFTLIHDDIQDMAELRRHRQTVWSLWGMPQAINAGDAMFAAAHVALNRSVERGVPAHVVLDLSTALHATTLRIVEGQVLDLGFERRGDVSSREYLTMIEGKTAAIIRFACWAGARIAGVPADQALGYGELGNAIGMGFQIRDDYLGVWGATETTGKALADDVRRRKQALPILLLKERVSAKDHDTIQRLYVKDELAPSDVQLILDLLEKHEISQSVQVEVTRWHDRAHTLLQQLGLSGDSATILESLLEELVNRDV